MRGEAPIRVVDDVVDLAALGERMEKVVRSLGQKRRFAGANDRR
jgi:hypothetical protein